MSPLVSSRMLMLLSCATLFGPFVSILIEDLSESSVVPGSSGCDSDCSACGASRSVDSCSGLNGIRSGYF